MPDTSLAAEALRTANEAMQMATIIKTELHGHEVSCGRRYEEWATQSGRTEKALDRLYGMAWKAQTTIIGLLIVGLATVLWYMLTKK